MFCLTSEGKTAPTMRYRHIIVLPNAVFLDVTWPDVFHARMTDFGSYIECVLRRPVGFAWLQVILGAVCLQACGTVSPRSPAYEHAFSRQVIDIPVDPQQAIVDESMSARRQPVTRIESLRQCQAVKNPKVYALGSSTMASLLGPALKKRLLRAHPKAKFAQWGKPSSGLARPDFHDWPSEVPRIIRRHKPDMFVVSLGTNDYQAVRLRNRKWVRPYTPKWTRVYASRVRKMLDLMSGDARRRLIVWVGPTSFPGDNPRKMGPLISDIIRQEISAFSGPAVFVDAFAATSDSQHQPLDSFRVKGKRKKQPMRSHDGIHLTIGAVRALMAQPALQHVLDCIVSETP